MKKLSVLIFVFCLLACGGGGGSTGGGIIVAAPSAPPPAPVVSGAEWELKGDSMAVGLDRAFPAESSHNPTYAGTVDSFVASPDTRLLRNVIVWIGVNSISDDPAQNIDDLCVKYSQMLWSIKATGRVYCVAVPKVSGYPDRWLNIEKLNAHIKGTCGEPNYIDTWAMPIVFSDGLHPDDASNKLVYNEIMARAAH